MNIETFEMHTKARITPSLTRQQLAEALMNKSEFDQCIHTYTGLKIEGSNMNLGERKLDIILKHIKIDSLASGLVQKMTYTSFQWVHAEQKICKDFGLTSLKLIGTKNNITGIILSAIVELKDQQKQKFIRIIKTLKQKYPKVLVTWENCQQTIACNIEEG